MDLQYVYIMPPKPKALSLFKNKGVSKRALQL
jgi:hypothetical protein